MRTRFAPSPTGYLHVGGLRTALYAWLLAKQTGGQFLVRVEDTDKEREVPGAIAQMLKALHWAGIRPDEGVVLDENGEVAQRGEHGPYIQSERLHLYKAAAEKLLAQGDAYYAFDTKDDIEAMRNREQAAGNPAPKYDAGVRMRMRNSLTLPKEETDKLLADNTPYVIRLKMPEGETLAWDDAIRGQVSFHSRDVDDQVLLKSDGFPTYHLAHVVDDHLMKIDLVLRGEEWLSSTPKHLVLFSRLGYPVPRYAHVPLMLNSDRSKLSKRQGDVSVDEYSTKGYLPEALNNFIAFLGWNPGTTQELFTLDDMIQAFSLERVQKGGAVFDLQKLDWLQGQWMRILPEDDFVARARDASVAKVPQVADDADFAKKAHLIRERITFFTEAPDMVGFFYVRPTPDLELLANPKQKVSVTDLPRFLGLLESILDLIPEDHWNDQRILGDVKAYVEKNDMKLGQILWPLRAALTGRAFSPGATEVAGVLGKEETMERIRAAMKVAGA
jgi:glutamyl-tRNA synthetase